MDVNKNCLKNIGANIRRLRKEAKMTIEELADKSGLSSKYMQGVETAKNNISVLNLENIAKALDVNLQTLITTNTECFKLSNEKLGHISSRLKNYSSTQLSAVYEMLAVIEAFSTKEEKQKLLVKPRNKALYAKG